MIRRTALSLVISGLMTSAYAATIDVTTLADEDGENASACSLREALKASELERAYGGCTAGKRDETDEIQLKAGEYVLTRGELVPNSSVIIRGKSSIDINQRDPVTGVYDARVPLTTIIRPTNSRALNTSVTRTSLTLQELIIDGGKALGVGRQYGGAVLAGSSLSLRRVTLRNNSANTSGGAIYLEGSQSSLNAEDTAFERNSVGSLGNAGQAAVLGMTCGDNLKLTSRNIEIQRSSIVNNGSDDTQTILEFCGIPAVKISNTTIANNRVSNQASSATISILDDEFGRRTSLASVLELSSVTLVANQGAAALLYDGRAQLRVVNSILAYNQNFDCRYEPRDGVRLAQLNGITTRSNLIGGSRRSPSTDQTITYDELFDLPLSRSCQLPSNVTNVPFVPLAQDDPLDSPRTIDYTRVTESVNAADSNRYTGSTPQDELLYPLADYGIGLQGLLPRKPSRVEFASALDRGATLSECGPTDQRGVNRQSGVKIKLTNTADAPRCDVGAMELGQVTVNDDGDGVNLSYVEQIDAKRLEFTDQELADFTAEERELVARVNRENDRYKTQLRTNFSYRRAFLDVFSNDVPQEVVSTATNPPTSRFVERYSGEYEVINVTSYGTGPDVLLTDQTPIDDNKNAEFVKCVWIEDMKRLAVYRTDGVTTPSGSFERCGYTVKAPDGTISTGIVQTRITNIRPIAKDDEYPLRRGQESISFNILENDSDDGDGPVGTLHQPADRQPFFNGTDRVNIKIKKAPQLGRLVFEREAPCPDNTATTPTEICYGGRATYLVNNTFSPFNDSFTYVVLDQDKSPSNEATVRIINDATTTEDTRTDRKGILGGGGALGWLGLFGLAGLAAVAQRRRRM